MRLPNPIIDTWTQTIDNCRGPALSSRTSTHVSGQFPPTDRLRRFGAHEFHDPGNKISFPVYADGDLVSRLTRSSERKDTQKMKRLKASARCKYPWLLLSLTLVAASLLWSNAASASCNFLSILASIGSGDGQVLTPRAIATDPSDNVFVADQNDRIQKFNSSGVFQFKFGTGGSGTGSVVAPSGVAVNRTTGDIYVSDGFSERTSGIVQKFNSSGVFQLSWGTSGSGNGQFLNGAGGVAVDSAGNVYVTDLGNHRIEKFTSSGSFIMSWGSSGTGNGQFSGPEGIATDASDNIYIADTGNHRIQKFNTSGAFLTK